MRITKKIANRRSGTSFRGHLYAQYDQLVIAFGKPYESDVHDTKTDVEWVISTPHGVATIYNYKNGVQHLGTKGLAAEQICEWHIGGRNDQTYKWIKAKIFGVVELLI